jgi:STE24 endopeptidase
MWIFLCGLVLALNVLFPVVIAPLFNKFTPLQDGPVRQGLERLIEQTGITGCSCDSMYEVDGSKQSAHSNAYVAGMCGTRRIVVYDTLVDDLAGDVAAIQSVVGHEIGHAMLKHTHALLAITCTNLFLMFAGFGAFASEGRGLGDALLRDFGFGGCAGAAVMGQGRTFLIISLYIGLYEQAFQPFAQNFLLTRTACLSDMTFGNRSSRFRRPI